MNVWIIAFVVVDIVVTAAIVLFVLRRRIRAGVVSLPVGTSAAELAQIRPLTVFDMERQERMADFVRANWSGDPGQLPGVLAALMDQLDGEARAQGHTFSRALLKTVVGTSLRSQRVAKDGWIGDALDKVA